jgi:hypothetical protein
MCIMRGDIFRLVFMLRLYVLAQWIFPPLPAPQQNEPFSFSNVLVSPSLELLVV